MAHHPLMEFFRDRMGDEDSESDKPKIAADIEAIRLRDSLDAYQTAHAFRPGMIVRQKKQAKMYRDFGDNDHGIVVEVLDTPIIAGEDKQGSPHFRERCDVLIGCIEQGHNGDCFCVFHVDSRRFEPVPDGELRLKVSNGLQ